jgi:hypothetical protein
LDGFSNTKRSRKLDFNIEVEAPDIIRNLSGMTKSWEMKGWTREVLGYRKVKYIHTYIFGEYEALNEHRLLSILAVWRLV